MPLSMIMFSWTTEYVNCPELRWLYTKFGKLANTTDTLTLPATVSDVCSMIALAMSAIRQTSLAPPEKS